MKDQKAELNNLRIAPRKVRLIADLIRGRSVNDAEGELILSKNRASHYILKLLRSAVSDVKNNQKESSDKLVIKSIAVDKGRVMKRFRPRARGSASLIEKKSSHITIVIGEGKNVRNKFNIIVIKKEKAKDSVKEEDKKPKAKPATENLEKSPDNAPKEKTGVLKKMFRRKSV